MTKYTSLSTISGPMCATLHAAAFPPGQEWDIDFFTKLLNLPTTRGMAVWGDDTPVGFILWQHGPDVGEIYTLVVQPNHRRQGLASALLSQAERELQRDGIARILLDVATDNPAALQLYMQNGFAEIARRKAYYQRADDARVDAIVMQKTLVS